MTTRPAQSDRKAEPDRNALLLMLAYVEAECRRLGAEAAAHHAALAAALVPERPASTGAPARAAALH